MLYGEIKNQCLRIQDAHVVAETIDYLEFEFRFTDDWDGLEKWAHFANKKEDIVYDIALSPENRIRKEDHLNLSAGTWVVYLHGNLYTDGEVVQRITTSKAALWVDPTGILNGEPLPDIPPSAAEQILARVARLEDDQLHPVDKTASMTQPVGRDEAGRLWTRPGGDGGGGSGGGTSYDIGYGLVLDGGILSAEVGADSFAEISNAKLQEIFNKAMEG